MKLQINRVLLFCVAATLGVSWAELVDTASQSGSDPPPAAERAPASDQVYAHPPLPHLQPPPPHLQPPASQPQPPPPHLHPPTSQPQPASYPPASYPPASYPQAISYPPPPQNFHPYPPGGSSHGDAPRLVAADAHSGYYGPQYPAPPMSRPPYHPPPHPESHPGQMPPGSQPQPHVPYIGYPPWPRVNAPSSHSSDVAPAVVEIPFSTGVDIAKSPTSFADTYRNWLSTIFTSMYGEQWNQERPAERELRYCADNFALKGHGCAVLVFTCFKVPSGAHMCQSSFYESCRCQQSITTGFLSYLIPRYKSCHGKLFTSHELMEALNSKHEESPDLDEIHFELGECRVSVVFIAWLAIPLGLCFVAARFAMKIGAEMKRRKRNKSPTFRQRTKSLAVPAEGCGDVRLPVPTHLKSN